MAKGYPMSKDETGKIYGKLTVLYQVFDDVTSKRAKWFCTCECGRTKIILGTSLRYGNTKSCGMCNKIFFKGKKKETPFNSILYRIKHNAKTRNLEWNITDDMVQILTKSECFYCGCAPTQRHKTTGHADYIYNGIDRVDNTKGYIQGNVVSCCKICNTAKNNLTVDQFKNMIKSIYTHWLSGSHINNK